MTKFPLPANSLAGALDGISAIAVAAYLGAVVYRGNTSDFGSALLKDAPGFLEFLVALYILTVIVNIPGPVGSISSGLVTLAIIVVIIRIASGSGSAALQQFGNGQISLFQLIQKLAMG